MLRLRDPEVTSWYELDCREHHTSPSAPFALPSEPRKKEDRNSTESCCAAAGSESWRSCGASHWTKANRQNSCRNLTSGTHCTCSSEK
jgi:hypothetical protein